MIKTVMTFFSSQRFFMTLLISTAGALLAAQIDGYWPRTIAIVTLCGIVITIILDENFTNTRKSPNGENSSSANPLHKHSEFLTMINALPNPILIISENRVIAANLSAIQLLGAPLIGQNIAGAFRHSTIIEKLSQIRNETSENNEVYNIFGLGHREKIWEMRVQYIDNIHRLVQLFDKSANQAAEKMRVDFVANASHELLTPLASIKGFIETLSDKQAGADSKTRNKFLNIIANETQRMESLIRDLMSLSRIESGSFADRAEDVRLIDITEQAVNSLKKGSDKRGKDIILTAGKDIPCVFGDKELLRQMIINIIANSMRYAKKDTPILVRLEKTQSATMLRLTVKDHGNGIAEEHIPRLTERFYRIDSGRSKALGGTGLGLSLVKHIVQRHSGYMDISSKKGDGTRTTILLPIAAKEHENLSHIPRPKRSLQNSDNP